MKFILIADSICGGFGQRSGKSFVHYSLIDLGFENSLIDYSCSGMTTTDFLAKSEIGFILRNIKSSDFVIISLGNVDSKPVYTKNNFFSFFVPRRYRAEKLDPRPYYSTSRLRRMFEKFDNYLRMISRFFCFYSNNYDRKVSQEVFVANFLRILDQIDVPRQNIILITPSAIDESLFPGAANYFAETQDFIEHLGGEYGVKTFDFKTLVTTDDYLLDLFHLNENGHQKVRKNFTTFIKGIV